MKESESRRIAYFLYSLLVIGLVVFLYFAFTISERDRGTVSDNCSVGTVSHVVDGDTFDLTDGTRVRMIGIDAPELNDTRVPVEFFAQESHDELQKLVGGKSVRLCSGGNDTVDKYDRQLRYVYVDDDFINADMVKDGYAYAYTEFPFEYSNEFVSDQKQAENDGKGLWNTSDEKRFDEARTNAQTAAGQCGTDTICPDDAHNFYGEEKTVRFYVARAYDAGSAVFLNSLENYEDPTNFTAVIFNSSRQYFPNDPASFYGGKTVEVHGKIKEYNGSAEIVLTNADDIKIVLAQ